MAVTEHVFAVFVLHCLPVFGSYLFAFDSFVEFGFVLSCNTADIDRVFYILFNAFPVFCKIELTDLGCDLFYGRLIHISENSVEVLVACVGSRVCIFICGSVLLFCNCS